jgi:hypothetical protein
MERPFTVTMSVRILAKSEALAAKKATSALVGRWPKGTVVIHNVHATSDEPPRIRRHFNQLFARSGR